MATLFKKAGAAEWYIRLAFIISGLIIAAPGVIGALSTASIHTLYAVAAPVGADAVLLQHRGVLLAIVGGLLITAGIVRTLRPAALAIGLLSNITFIIFTLLSPAAQASLARIAWVDVVLTLLLIGAYLAHTRQRKI